VAVALSLTALSLGGAWYGRHFLQQELSPLLEREFTRLLQRPVRLGRVQRVSLGASVRFGASEVPATPTEPNFVVVEAIEVQVNPWRYLRDRRLELDITVLRPQVFGRQDRTTGLLQLPSLPQPGAGDAGVVDVRTVTATEGQVTLLAGVNNRLLSLRGVEIQSRWNILDPGNQRLELTATGELVRPELPLAGAVPDPGALRRQIAAAPTSQGTLNLELDWHLTRGMGRATVRSPGVAVPVVGDFLVNMPLTPMAGVAAGELTVRIGEGEPQVQGTLTLEDGAVQLPQVPLPLTDVTATVRLDRQRVSVESLAATYDRAIALRGKGSYTLGGQLDGEVTVLLEDYQPPKTPIAVAIKGKSTITAKLGGTLPRPEISARVQLGPTQIDRVGLTGITAEVRTNNLGTVLIRNVRAQTDLGAEISGSGQLDLAEQRLLAALQLTELDGERLAERYDLRPPIRIGTVSAAVQVMGTLASPQIRATIAAPRATYPAQGTVLLAGDRLEVTEGQVDFPIGKVRVSGNYRLSDGTWQGEARGSGIPVAALAPDLALPGNTLEGSVTLRSPGGGFTLRDITGTASLRLPRGLAAIPDAIAGDLAWTGDTLLVSSLDVGSYLQASGRVAVQLTEGIPQAESVDLNVRSQDVPIARFAALLPALPRQSRGVLNFNGRLFGAVAAPQVDGDLRLEGVQVPLPLLPPTAGGVFSFAGRIQGAVFDPTLLGRLRLTALNLKPLEVAEITIDGRATRRGAQGAVAIRGLVLDRLPVDTTLTGQITYAPEGLTLDVMGERDRLALRLDGNLAPLSFAVALGNATATGTRSANRPERLDVTLANVPLGLAAALVGQEQIQGRLFGSLTVDLGMAPAALGTIEIQRPRFGRILAEAARAQIRYGNGRLVVDQGQIVVNRANEAVYGFQFTYDPQAEDVLAGAIAINRGEMADLFATLQWVNPNDIARGLQSPRGRAADLASISAITLRQLSLYAQLQYLAQLQELAEQRDIRIAQQNNNLPPLTEFKGTVGGQVQFGLSRQRGLRLAFDLKGEGFEYGKFAVDDVLARGSFASDRLNLDVLKLQSGDRLGQITNAQLGLLAQSGTIELRNFPIESLRPLPFFEFIPVEVTGNLNGTATLAGNLLDFRSSGNLRLDQATINRQPIAAATTEFTYANERLAFRSSVLVTGDEPLDATGNLPLRLPFLLSLRPPSTDIYLDVQVKNQGLSALNIFDQPLRWLGGSGAVQLNIQGTFAQPQINGTAQFNQASLQLAGFPGTFTAVQGGVAFDRDRLSTDLRGQFNQGDVMAKGSLSLSDPNLTIDEPLTIMARNLKLTIADLSAENASGTVMVGGTVLEPSLSGDISLADGRFVIGNEDTSALLVGGNSLAIALNDLRVKLDNMQVTRFPLFNFLTKGTLTVGGTLANPLPSGRLAILRGQFNAISARFRLDRAFDNYAEFTPAQGLNPSLNVRVAGSVPEITRVPIAVTRPTDAFTPQEVPTSSLGAQRTLRVQATVTGSASNPTITLSSSPPRNQAELTALIGGGVLQQAGTDPAAALANLAGGTVLNFIQDAIGDALNLAEFNLSPVTTAPSSTSGSRLGLSAEAAIDISNSFSAAIQTIINDPAQGTNYAIRYRLDPTLLLRGNINSQGELGVSIEYETRF